MAMQCAETLFTPLFVQEDYDARKELWEAIDVNGNGFLSLAEVTKVVFLIIIIIIIIFVIIVIIALCGYPPK